MGVDLELVPIDFVVPLSTDRDYELWVEIGKIGTVPSPDFDSERCGNPPTDARGRPLVCVTAGELAALSGHPAVVSSECNRAAWAYLAALKPDRLVALYWC